MELMSGAQMLVRTLEDLGVDRLFGYPGGAVLDIYDALLASKKIKHILARHEQGAAHMADGYARVSGKVGCALVTSGPGATNTVTAIATAYMDSIPMVVITGQVISPLIGSDAFQEVDTVGITRPIVKHSFLCQNALDIPKYLREAFYLASTGRPGPVVVDVPKDCVRPTDKFEYPPMGEIKMRTYNPTKLGHRGQVKRAAKMLAEARRPVMMVGGGVILGNASSRVRDLAHRFNLPVTATLMGLGAFPSTDRQFLGMLGMHGTFEANEAMDKCDLVLAIGVRFDDRVTNDVSKFCPAAKIIHIDVDPTSISKTITADIPIVGEADSVLGQFNEAISELQLSCNTEDLEKWWSQINVWRQKKCLAYKKDKNLCQPQEVIEAVYKATGGKAIIATDVGQHQMFTALYYPFDNPRQFLTSGGLGTMGYGFPAAVGAKVAKPDEEVCLITGDGSFQMNIQELSTCFEFNIPVKIFILDNHTLGMVRQWQKLFYGGRISSTNLNYNPDFVALAKAYGHEAILVEKPSELDDAVKKALSMKDKLVIVDVLCNTDAKVMPMQQPKGGMADMFLAEEN
ncbi:biosynthetic-type acetolactate synthase large subunit [Succinatimonas hippei]|uniref:Acetolactate synthase n=1 Tax=Succinatimonas hippei (strain DSM 22608 / JCM 16073 / KCTC 15190 / YIT 12066) TaxID=762983 RepID=E8LLK5_SUCHY|nr:biosynthetic-type acetolactate synthase large subunit [Succinatimonas hippei]EFY06599.1 acetolactate synthase, large subunit, biosynthetic type [Succinatimonas hippei YIT 12066]